jgi:rhodanese-related sulfurtransferase
MIEEVPPSTLESWLADDDPLQVVDVRSERAYRTGHVPGALNVPYPELPARVEAVEWCDRVVVACPHGESSVGAARLLAAYEGVSPSATVASLDGGYRALDESLLVSGE